ncbi:MAG: glutaminyl-peptide cyclotransferase [Verrucomicrobiales bacterium]|nr:glutaminyl-peptide cyclotransferase [Verrucomicrobiota bacterium JB025]
MKLLLATLLAATLASCEKAPEPLQYQIISKRHHDPACYTQGLEFHGNRLFESGGQYGQSTIREVNPADGSVIRSRSFPASVFAEGITLLDDRLFMLTWHQQTAYVLEPDTFKLITRHTYEGEGWGLTNDGKQLIMSNGSATLRFINPSDFTTTRTVDVTDGTKPVDQLNELEYIDGRIFANIYQTEKVARIDAATGEVTAWLDLSSLRSQLNKPNNAEVLNGIARDPATGHLLITGKYWPNSFEIKLNN